MASAWIFTSSPWRAARHDSPPDPVAAPRSFGALLPPRILRQFLGLHTYVLSHLIVTREAQLRLVPSTSLHGDTEFTALWQSGCASHLHLRTTCAVLVSSPILVWFHLAANFGRAFSSSLFFPWLYRGRYCITTDKRYGAYPSRECWKADK